MSISLVQSTSPRRAGVRVALVAIVALLALVLSGCSLGGGAETETSYTKTQNGATVTMTFYAKGDTVTKQTTHSVLKYGESGLKDKDAAKAYFDPIIEQFQNVKGLTHSMQYTDTEVIEDLTVDYSEADISEISKLIGSQFEGGSKQKGVSLKKTVEGLEAGGFTKVG